MKTFVKIVAALFFIFPETPAKADQFGVEWEYVFAPSLLWEQATGGNVMAYGDEKGGCVAMCEAIAYIQGREIKRTIAVFLNEDGEERYRFELDDGYPSDGYPIIITSKRVVFQMPGNNLAGTKNRIETVFFEKNGEVKRTSLVIQNNSDWMTFENNTPWADARSDDKSYIFTASNVGSVQVLKKWSFGADNSPKPAPVLFSGVNGSNAIIAWDSAVGTQYQVQKSTDLETWSDVGLPITGTGEQMNYSEANLRNKLYLRVVIP